MTETTKRFIKSTLETFLATFAVTAYIVVNPAIDAFLQNGTIPTKELLVSAAFAGLVAAVKVSAKSVREFVIPLAKKYISAIISKALDLPLQSNEKE